MSGLVAYDISDDIMIGAFTISGENEIDNRDFSRAGVQFQADFGDARIQALYVAGFRAGSQACGRPIV